MPTCKQHDMVKDVNPLKIMLIKIKPEGLKSTQLDWGVKVHPVIFWI